MALLSHCSLPGFGVEQAAYGVQTQNYPKGSLLDVCPSSSAPSVLGSEQEFQMLPKSRLSTVSVNYCPVGQDFPSGNLNLLASSSGRSGLRRAPSVGGGLLPGASTDRDRSSLGSTACVQPSEEVRGPLWVLSGCPALSRRGRICSHAWTPAVFQALGRALQSRVNKTGPQLSQRDSRTPWDMLGEGAGTGHSCCP